ncbi:MAG: type II secretion system protein GspG [Planctomycetes bacterium]|nr:type II secretion system protein GspG [Planctomycetota bacterium]
MDLVGFSWRRCFGFSAVRATGLLVVCAAVLAVAAASAGWMPLVVAGSAPAHTASDECIASMQLQAFAMAARFHAVALRRLPESLDDLTTVPPRDREPILATVPRDPWGRPYRYRVLDRVRGVVAFGCVGADGEAGTPDDFYLEVDAAGGTPGPAAGDAGAPGANAGTPR